MMKNRYRKSIKLSIGLLVGLLECMKAQDVPTLIDNQAWLSTFGTEQTTKAAQEKADAIVMAQKLNIPVRKVDANGSTIELIRFENSIPIYLKTNNAVAAATISSNKVYPGGSWGGNLTGSGITLSEWDGGAVLATHQELTGRVTQVDGVVSPLDHSTHVAGTMVASGVVSSAKGMSYQANLNAYDWNNNLSEISSTNTTVSNHSYGFLTGWTYGYQGYPYWFWFGDQSLSTLEDYRFGFYDSEAQNWDQMLYNKPSHLAVKAAGNDRGEGPAGNGANGHYAIVGSNFVWNTTTRNFDGNSLGYNSVTDASNAKNVLTVGAVDDLPSGYTSPAAVVMSSFSGWGPTDDGRIKPDVVANGIGLYSCLSTANNAYASLSGTSMATPSVSGSVGLLLQHEKNVLGSNAFRASTLKAIAIHTADDAGSAGPDYKFGWGLMNTTNAATLISNHAQYCRHIKEFNLSNGGTIDLLVNKTANQNLKVTICWTDPAGTSPSPSLNPSTKMLVNDLDMRVTHVASSVISSPYVLGGLANPMALATTGDNVVDNVEQILVTDIASGVYQIKINHKGALSGGNQIVSVIITGNDGVVNTMNIANITLSSGADKTYSYSAESVKAFAAQSGSKASFKARTSIIIEPVTSFDLGSVVIAEINPTDCYLASNARKAKDEVSTAANFKDLVHTNLEANTLFAYPNPISSGMLNFSRNVASYKLLNVAGEAVMEGSNTDHLNTDGLTKGLYLLHLDDQTLKVVIE